MRLETSWDDGGLFDRKLADLLIKYNMPAVFYIPTLRAIDPVTVKWLSEHFEIGGHTVTHPQDLKLCDDTQLKYQIEDNKAYLEDLIGKPVTKFCYPRGRHDERVRQAVKDAGYLEARTTVVLETGMDYDPFQKPTTIHAYQRLEYKDMPWALVAREYMEKAKQEDGVFHLWGHSEEINRYNDWGNLEQVLQMLSVSKGL